MDVVDKFYSIDARNELKQVTSRGIELWPILRLYYFEKAERKEEGSLDRTVKINHRFIFMMIRSLFFGFHNIRKLFQVKTLVFSAGYRNKMYDGKYIDSIAGGIINYYKNDVCVIENPYPDGHIKLCRRYNHRVVSESILFLIAYVIGVFSKKFKIIGEEELNKLHSELDVEVNYRSILSRYVGQYRTMKWLLKYMKVKQVYIVSSCSYLGYIRAFKEKGISVIELQHGTIHKKHFYYNPREQYDRFFYPDYFLTFGTKDVNVLCSNCFISKDQIFPVGNYLLSLIAQKKCDRYKLERQKYRIIIAFSAQLPFEHEAINFLKEVISLDHSILIKYIPRNTSKDYSKFALNDNIQVDRETSIYDAILSSDLHSTISSTCAIEALFLGKQNLIVDIHHESVDFYKDFFDETYSFFVDTPDKYVLQTKQLREIEPSLLINSVSSSYISDYNNKFESFVKEYLR